MALQKIISAGQRGAEYAALMIAESLGMDTGGIVPKGWGEGYEDELKRLSLVEHKGYAYPPCIEENIKNSDGTLIVGRVDVPPASLSRVGATIYKKTFIINPTPDELRAWIEAEQISTLHVSGTKLTDLDPGIESTTSALLLGYLSYSLLNGVTNG
jgi:hypothetical protein